MQRIPAAPPSEISELARCCAVFVPGDPARTGRVAFWRPDGSVPPPHAAGSARRTHRQPDGVNLDQLDAVAARQCDAQILLAVLTRARTDAHAHRGAVFWGSAAVPALQLLARGLLLPGLSPGDHDAWRAGPLPLDDASRIRGPAAATPPEAPAIPVDGSGPLRPPTPERLLRAFLDAVADTLPRSPAACLVGPAYAAQASQHLPRQWAWAADVARSHPSTRSEPR